MPLSHCFCGQEKTAGDTRANAGIQAEAASAPQRRPWYSVLYIQVLIAIALGVLIGHFYPRFGEQLKPLGDAFIALIKMLIAPVIFCTLVHGIASAIGEAMERKPITL